MKRQIINEIYKAFVILGAGHDLLSTIGSISDSIDYTTVVANLRGWNAAALNEVKDRIEHCGTLRRQ